MFLATAVLSNAVILAECLGASSFFNTFYFQGNIDVCPSLKKGRSWIRVLHLTGSLHRLMSRKKKALHEELHAIRSSSLAEVRHLMDFIFSIFTIRACADTIYVSFECALAQSVGVLKARGLRLVSRRLHSHTLEPRNFIDVDSTMTALTSPLLSRWCQDYRLRFAAPLRDTR